MGIVDGRHIGSKAHYKISIILHNNTSKPTMNPAIHSSTQNTLRLRREFAFTGRPRLRVVSGSSFSVVEIGYVCGSKRQGEREVLSCLDPQIEDILFEFEHKRSEGQ